MGDVGGDHASARRQHPRALRDQPGLSGTCANASWRMSAERDFGWNGICSALPGRKSTCGSSPARAMRRRAPSEIESDGCLANGTRAAARARVDGAAGGTKRVLSRAILTPGYPGWPEAIDRAIAELEPDSFKGDTIGDTTHENLSRHPWRLDDETLAHPACEKSAKAGLVGICILEGLFPPSVARRFPQPLRDRHLRRCRPAAATAGCGRTSPTASWPVVRRGPERGAPGRETSGPARSRDPAHSGFA